MTFAFFPTKLYAYVRSLAIDPQGIMQRVFRPVIDRHYPMFKWVGTGMSQRIHFFDVVNKPQEAMLLVSDRHHGPFSYPVKSQNLPISDYFIAKN